ncbi:M23 family metallopeptidase [Prolixibacteraceae bacterium Z1-6]|uniref:M23 family metallopeptidase n=1 Tax=Draconibacterium aestuarii TaxID=2998507 RepID=A0A9X3J629_9BACT|nr:M23 family metallopeptidase [Prolixibacteraceae bacterium Z1-6]
MKRNYILLLLSVFITCTGKAQLVDVQADYNGVGDCIFSATNNSKAPVFLHINFADLQNTTFPETLPYVKRLTPGFNSLFTLQRNLDADIPSFHYEIKSFRSNPMADVDLNFPYLIPFQDGEKIRVFDVENIDGFAGNSKPDSWSATGFYANAGTPVCACRNGVVVEIVGVKRNEDSQSWYNGWNYCITIMQPSGTLICYRNVFDKQKKLNVGQTIYAGEIIGEIAPGKNTLEILIYHHSLNTNGLLFVIPQFVIAEGKNEFVNSSTEYTVIHPNSVRGLEMTKRERKKILGVK